MNVGFVVIIFTRGTSIERQKWWLFEGILKMVFVFVNRFVRLYFLINLITGHGCRCLRVFSNCVATLGAACV